MFTTRESFRKTFQADRKKVKKCKGCGEEIPIPSHDQSFRESGGRICDNCRLDEIGKLLEANPKPPSR